MKSATLSFCLLGNLLGAQTPPDAYPLSAGTLQVPELRSAQAKARGSIQLGYVRLQRGQHPSRIAHVVLAGGPGDSGTELVRGLGQRGGNTLPELFDGDVIGMDQRGTGASTPNLRVEGSYELPLDQPASPERWLPLMERKVRATARALRERGVRLEAYTTSESADDLEDLRKTLGYERLVIWGRSYGSHLALAFLRRHPRSVSRMILVGPEGPDHTWKLPSQAETVLQRLNARTERKELLHHMASVLENLRKQTVTVQTRDPGTGLPATIALGAFDVQWVTAQALGNPATLATLPVAYRRMATGDFSAFAPLAVAHRRHLGVGSAMKHAMDLSSGASKERRARIQAEAATTILGNALNFPDMYLDAAWGVPEAPPSFRAAVSSPVPTLILVGDLDARTPVENAREIAATLLNAHVVVVENAAHAFDVFGSPPILSILRRFLKDEPVTEGSVPLPPLRIQE